MSVISLKRPFLIRPKLVNEQENTESKTQISVVELYSKKTPVTDIILVCKKNDLLYYSKYQLYSTGTFFKTILEADSSVTEIELLDYDNTTVALMLLSIDSNITKDDEFSRSINFIELYKLSFYIEYKRGIELSSRHINNIKSVTPEIYNTLKQFKYPINDDMISNLIKTSVGYDGGIIDDICSYHVREMKRIKNKVEGIKRFITDDAFMKLMSSDLMFSSNIRPLIEPQKKCIIEYIQTCIDIDDEKVMMKNYDKDSSIFYDPYKKCSYIISTTNQELLKKLDGCCYDVDKNDKKRVKEFWGIGK